MNENISLTIANRWKRDLVVILEPWADAYTIPPEKKMTMSGIFDQERNNFEVEYEGNHITVWWPGDEPEMHIDGKVAIPGPQIFPNDD